VVSGIEDKLVLGGKGVALVETALLLVARGVARASPLVAG